ncbi:hypothetical protein [Rhizobium grahamii]|nr:hypothetical protein [Rhizobium grahamii]
MVVDRCQLVIEEDLAPTRHMPGATLQELERGVAGELHKRLRVR